MSCTPYNLLRRTFLVVAACAAIASTPALAQQVKKSEDGSVLCSTYTGIQVQPSGGIAITGCSGTVVQPPPTGAAAPDGTFTVNGASQIDASKTAYLWYSVSRSGSLGGSSSAASITMTATGGCSVPPSAMQFAAGSGDTYQAFTVVAPTDSTGKIYNTTCTITIQQQNPALTLGNGGTGSIQVQVINGTGTAPGSGGGTVAGCPAIPVDAVANFPIHFGGNDLNWLNSGQIGYAPLPTFASWGGGGASAKLITGITTGSLDGTVEMSINKCPGVIDTTGAYKGGATGGNCYKKITVDASLHWLTWFEAPGINPSATDAEANQFGICEAYASNGPWYVNVRYNTTSGARADYLWQYNWDSYAP